MSTERRAELVRMLRERQADIRTRLRTLREDLPAVADHVKDPEEQCVDDYLVNLDISLAEAGTATLRRIEDAIARVDAGTYGSCLECEDEISAARLQALPFADLCVDCQQAREDAAA